MIGIQNPALLGVVCAILVTGWLSACAARLSVGARQQGICQSVFLFCLVLVGAVTVLALGMAPGFWVVSGATFSIMVLTATWDFGQSNRVAAW